MASSSADFDARLVSVADFEREALDILPRNARDYYRSGAGDEFTLALNKEVMKRWRLRPRVLRDVSQRCLRSSALGSAVSVPFGLAPSAMQQLAHPEGELASSRAAEEIGGVFVLSSMSTFSVEEVTEAAPNAVKWLQLFVYISEDRTVTSSLVRRAEAAGFKALVLTVDAPVMGNRRAVTKNKFALPPHLRLANFEDSRTSGGQNASPAGFTLDQYILPQSIGWEEIQWFKQITRLPLVLKGVLTAEDAVMAVEAGVNAIFVSNHGGRQVDGVPASLEVLPEIVKAVQGRCEIYVDGGFQQGNDIFKALALGANMVFVGRPVLWGLAHSGQAGVYRVLDILRKELDSVMTLTGCSSIKAISKDLVVHESFYCRL